MNGEFVAFIRTPPIIADKDSIKNATNSPFMPYSPS
jgi:hypothetical protein